MLFPNFCFYVRVKVSAVNPILQPSNFTINKPQRIDSMYIFSQIIRCFGIPVIVSLNDNKFITLQINLQKYYLFCVEYFVNDGILGYMMCQCYTASKWLPYWMKLYTMICIIDVKVYFYMMLMLDLIRRVSATV